MLPVSGAVGTKAAVCRGVFDLLPFALNEGRDEAQTYAKNGSLSSFSALIYNSGTGHSACLNPCIPPVDSEKPGGNSVHFGQMKNLALFICVIILFTVQAFADPVITGVSGTLKHGSTITITGAGFGQKDPAPPIIWADFEDGKLNPSKLGQMKRWSGSVEYSNFAITTENQAPHSQYSVVGVYSPRIHTFSFEVVNPPEKGGWTRVYNFQKRYYDFDHTGNQNFWMLLPGTNGGTGFGATWDSEGGRCGNGAEGYAGGVIGSYQGTPYTKHQWFTEEFTWQFEGGTGRNLDGTRGPGGTGIWDYTRNGRKVQHRENVNNGPIHPTRLIADNYIAEQALPPEGSKVYMDDIYIDDTYARVMIGNASTLARSTVREIQIPSTWSDVSITVMLNQGGFIEFDRVYLYVIDANGDVNREGYPLNANSSKPAQ